MPQSTIALWHFPFKNSRFKATHLTTLLSPPKYFTTFAEKGMLLKTLFKNQ